MATGAHDQLLKALLPDDGIERVAAVFLRAGMVVDCRHLAIGVVAGVNLRARHVMHPALHFGADQMVLAHNHPSGNVQPSRWDLIATRKLLKIAETLGVELLDHLIFSKTHVFSMKTGRVACLGSI